jgi:hypothetical protein
LTTRNKPGKFNVLKKPGLTMQANGYGCKSC